LRVKAARQTAYKTHPLAAQSVAIVYLLYILIRLNEDVALWQVRYVRNPRQHPVHVPEISLSHHQKAPYLGIRAILVNLNPGKPRSPTGIVRNVAQC